MKKNLILFILIAIFLCNLNVYAQNSGNETAVYHPSLQKIVDDFTKHRENTAIITKTEDFSIEGKNFTAVYITSINKYRDHTSPEFPLSQKENTLALVCDKQEGGAVSDCRQAGLGGLSAEDITFAHEGDLLTFKLNNDEYFVTFKYTQNDFYLHQFSKRYLGEGDSNITAIYYETDSKTGHNIKMRDTVFEDLYSHKYDNNLIQKYPYLKKYIDAFVMNYTQGDRLDVNTKNFKIGNNNFLAVSILAFLSEEQLYSNTENWCKPLGGMVLICDDKSASSIPNCSETFIPTPTCKSSFDITNDLITFKFEDRYRRGHNIIYEYTFKYVQNDFYLHSYVAHNQNITREGITPLNTDLYYKVDPKEGYDRKMKDLLK